MVHSEHRHKPDLLINPSWRYISWTEREQFGKSAIVTAADLQEGATLLDRNKLIGGHNADE